MKFFATLEAGLCRAVARHAWMKRQGSAGLQVKGDVVFTVWDCARCGCTRFDQDNYKTGDQVERTYHREKNYAVIREPGERMPKYKELRRDVFAELVRGTRKRVVAMRKGKRAAAGGGETEGE